MGRRALTALLLTLSGCGVAQSPVDASLDQRQRLQGDLDQARSKWRLTGPHSYRYLLRQTCFCAFLTPEPLAVTVTLGRVTSVTTEGGAAVPPLALGGPLHVEGLFERIQVAIDRPAATLIAEYDPTYGFPSRISIDFIANAIDDEIDYRAFGFQASGG